MTLLINEAAAAVATPKYVRPLRSLIAGLVLRSLGSPVRSPDRAIGTTHLSGNSHDRLRQHDQ
jgi:hypothetical protein